MSSSVNLRTLTQPAAHTRFVFVKTHKTGSSTVANLLHTYAVRNNLSVVALPQTLGGLGQRWNLRNPAVQRAVRAANPGGEAAVVLPRQLPPPVVPLAARAARALPDDRPRARRTLDQRRRLLRQPQPVRERLRHQRVRRARRLPRWPQQPSEQQHRSVAWHGRAVGRACRGGAQTQPSRRAWPLLCGAPMRPPLPPTQTLPEHRCPTRCPSSSTSSS